MNKRYQVFVSSTYADLREERSKVIQALMEMDCIPAGMELFPAADEEQWEFIKKVIDDCDYYLLVIGGRYGSLTPEGISYTEKEFDYAVTRNMRVVALLHGSPESIPAGKSEMSPDGIEKLTAFRAKVGTGRLVKYWQAAAEIPGLVALSLSRTIKSYPAVGWVRADGVASVDLLAENNALRKTADDLKAEIAKLRGRARPALPGIAGLDAMFKVRGRASNAGAGQITYADWSGEVPWKTVFGLLAPHLLQATADPAVESIAATALHEAVGARGYSPRINDQVFQTIKVQLMAHGLVSVASLPTTKGGTALFWELTPAGREQMFALRTIKTADDAAGVARAPGSSPPSTS